MSASFPIDEDKELTPPEKAGSRKRKQRGKKDETKPEKVKKRTPWHFYLLENRQQIQSEFPTLPFKEISKIAAERYKSLTKEQMAIYEAKAAESKAEFNKQNPQKPDVSFSRAETVRRQRITAYYMFMTQRHSEIRKENPEMTYKERSQKIIEEWNQLSMIEKTKYEYNAFPRDQSSADVGGGDGDAEENDPAEDERLINDDDEESHETEEQDSPKGEKEELGFQNNEPNYHNDHTTLNEQENQAPVQELELENAEEERPAENN